jgi:hypothetical protein
MTADPPASSLSRAPLAADVYAAEPGEQAVRQPRAYVALDEPDAVVELLGPEVLLQKSLVP